MTKESSFHGRDGEYIFCKAVVCTQSPLYPLGIHGAILGCSNRAQTLLKHIVPRGLRFLGFCCCSMKLPAVATQCYLQIDGSITSITIPGRQQPLRPRILSRVLKGYCEASRCSHSSP